MTMLLHDHGKNLEKHAANSTSKKTPHLLSAYIPDAEERLLLKQHLPVHTHFVTTQKDLDNAWQTCTCHSALMCMSQKLHIRTPGKTLFLAKPLDVFLLLKVMDKLKQLTVHPLRSIQGFFYENAQCMRSPNCNVALTAVETQLIKQLLDAGPAGASKEHLLNAIWNMPQHLHTRTLHTHVHRIRKKLDHYGIIGERILANTSQGYKIVD